MRMIGLENGIELLGELNDIVHPLRTFEDLLGCLWLQEPGVYHHPGSRVLLLVSTTI